MSIFINNNNGPIYNDCDVTINNGVVDDAAKKQYHNAEDVEPIDLSFFCSDKYSEDIIEKNIREEIRLASSKADACRRIMGLETLGYIVLSNVKDERKAELVNPFSMPKFTLTGEDFRKARKS